MFDYKRQFLWENYNRVRSYFISDPDALILLECYITCLVNDIIGANYLEIEHDYNEASYLHPFWASYPPDGQGKAAAGEPIPWLEVGEHAVGHKLSRLIASDYQIAEIGLPTGADNRFVLYSDEISGITHEMTDCAFVHLTIKSAGPGADQGSTVISPNQMSGNGIWEQSADNVENALIFASGPDSGHAFHPAIPPVYTLTDGKTAPAIHLFIQPSYRMLSLEPEAGRGQPLKSIQSVCVPNGLLLTCQPNYLSIYPDLLRPEEAEHAPGNVCARVSLDVLSQIDRWRVSEFFS